MKMRVTLLLPWVLPAEKEESVISVNAEYNDDTLILEMLY